MAVQNCFISEPINTTSIKRGQYQPMANGDSGVPFGFPDWADRTIQVFGTFGAGGTLIIEGSNDLGPTPTNWTAMVDQNGTALSFTAAGVRLLNEEPLWIRPRVTAGDGTTAITVQASARRVLPLN